MLRLLFIALLPAIATVGLCYLEKKNKLRTVPYIQKQLIIGIVFGLLSILGSEFGIKIDNAIINTRDVAPICAGLIFGAPAGIISGIIGGLERFVSVYWNDLYYTRVACSIATIFAGCFSGILRKFLFDNKRPTWYYGFITTSIVEVVHMLLVFLTHTTDIKTAFNVVRNCFWPMLIINGLVVIWVLGSVYLISNPQKKKIYATQTLTQSFQKWLLISVILAFLTACGFSYLLQTSISYEEAKEVTSLYIDDINASIKETSDENIIAISKAVLKDIDNKEPTIEDLQKLKNKYNISAIHLIDKNGIIYASSDNSYIGFDMNSGKQSKEFICLLKNQKEYIQDFRPESKNSKTYMKYAGIRKSDGGFIQVGYDAKKFQEIIKEQITGITHNRHVGKNGYIILADFTKKIVSDPNGHEGQRLTLDEVDLKVVDFFGENNEKTLLSGTIFGEKCFCMYAMTESYHVLSVVPVSETFLLRDLSVYITIFMQIIISVSLFLIIYLLIKNLVVKNIRRVNADLNRITNGNLNVSVDVRDNNEFMVLSDEINKTVDTLKRYIDEASERIDAELEFAKTIQLSSLPRNFPQRDDFDVYGSMKPAKEVGGDFFDLYLLNDNKLVFLVADVSGKGISAAMFMMEAKSIIKGYAEQGLQVADILTETNKKLCAGNDAEMFVTCWMGILDLNTHKVQFANAGHNPPLIKHNGGDYEFFKPRPSLVLGGMDGIKYRQGEFELEPGSAIFLYTDGINEATDKNENMFGNNRLLETLHSAHNLSSKEICELVEKRTAEFVGTAPQFDDMTMLCLRIPLNTVYTSPINENTVSEVMGFVERYLDTNNIEKNAKSKILVAVDEICSNIVRYSKAQNLKISCEIANDILSVVFTDDGVEYDATKQKEPDITLGAEERDVGGLGIYIVKKTMDTVDYRYSENKNILTLTKKIHYTDKE